MLLLRSLNPQTEVELFQEAYRWRNKPPSQLRPDRMSFADFSADRPSQIVMGLFNGQLLAVYFFAEGPRGVFDCHYTCARDAPKDLVLLAGRKLTEIILENGGLELLAFVPQVNKPLRRAVEMMGFQPDCLIKFSPEHLFVKYAVRRKT